MPLENIFMYALHVVIKYQFKDIFPKAISSYLPMAEAETNEMTILPQISITIPNIMIPI